MDVICVRRNTPASRRETVSKYNSILKEIKFYVMSEIGDSGQPLEPSLIT